jgi:hypothetical protein
VAGANPPPTHSLQQGKRRNLLIPSWDLTIAGRSICCSCRSQTLLSACTLGLRSSRYMSTSKFSLMRISGTLRFESYSKKPESAPSALRPPPSSIGCPPPRGSKASAQEPPVHGSRVGGVSGASVAVMTSPFFFCFFNPRSETRSKLHACNTPK